MRLSRWRPCCPECGYSLRAAVAPRCPECGEPFPISARTFRRWANRRLRWERRQRGGWIAAYLATLAPIVLTPWRAARGLSIPDRRGRAIRWAIAHVSAAALLAALFTWFGNIWIWVEHPAAHPSLALLAPPPVGSVLTWIAQTFMVWLAALASPFAVALVLTELASWNQPAGRDLARKWSLYATAVVPLVCAVWVATAVGSALVQRFSLLNTLVAIERFPYIPAWVAAAAFGYVWSAGLAASPYSRRRGVLVFLGGLTCFAAAWALARYVLFPPGVLIWWF